MTRTDVDTDIRGKRIREVAELWRVVQHGPQHPAACRCMGLFLMPTMSPKDIENDVLEYLRGRYEPDDMLDLVRLLDERLAQHGTEPLSPLRQWLLELARHEATPANSDRLLTDLHHAGVCRGRESEKPGWIRLLLT